MAIASQPMLKACMPLGRLLANVEAELCNPSGDLLCKVERVGLAHDIMYPEMPLIRMLKDEAIGLLFYMNAPLQ